LPSAAREISSEKAVLSGQTTRLASVATLTECTIMRLDKATVVRALHEESALSEKFMAYLMARNARIEADLVAQLFNSSERRLARALKRKGDNRE
jgi:CRP/FNR family cyclic AMP-dependent transcriptional regulator